MDFYKKLTKLFGKPEKEKNEFPPEGGCPVCWGYQAYDDKIRVLYEDRQIDVNNHRWKYMRIQKLLKEKIEGMRLKKARTLTCPTCSRLKEASLKKSDYDQPHNTVLNE